MAGMQYKDPSGKSISQKQFQALQAQIQAGGGAGNVTWMNGQYVPKATAASATTPGPTPQDYTTGALPPGAPTAYEPAYGGIPQLPRYTTDTAQRTGTDIYGQLVKNLPGYTGMVGESSGNIESLLRGEIPSDVLTQLGQGAAERGIATGMPGAPATNSAYMRALGLTSLGLQKEGEGALTAAIQRTPIQTHETATQTTDWAAQQAIYNAMAQPGAAARANLEALKQGIRSGGGGVAQPPSFPGGGVGGPLSPTSSPAMMGAYGPTTPLDPLLAARSRAPAAAPAAPGTRGKNWWDTTDWYGGESAEPLNPYVPYQAAPSWQPPVPGGYTPQLGGLGFGDWYEPGISPASETTGGGSYTPGMGDLGFGDWYDPSGGNVNPDDLDAWIADVMGG